MSRFSDLSKLKGEEIPKQNGAGEGDAKPSKQKTAKKPSQTKEPPTKSVAAVTSERVSLTISPKSEVYAALVAARESFPPGFRDKNLSSVFLTFLQTKDRELAKEISKFFNDGS